MSEFSDWVQSNWFELASFLVQCAILATLFVYGRRASRALLALQDQAEAPQRLSPSKARGIRLTVQEAGVWSNLIRWFQEPMGEVAAWRRTVRWFQAPMGS